MELYAWTALIPSIIYGIVLLTKGDQGNLPKVSYEFAEETEGDIRNLTCYSCQLSVHGNSCMTMETLESIDTEDCRAGEYFCKVRWYEADGKLETFERGCADTCEGGCEGAVGVFPVKVCHKCCREDLCNTDSAASNSLSQPAFIITAILVSHTAQYIVKQSVD